MRWHFSIGSKGNTETTPWIEEGTAEGLSWTVIPCIYFTRYFIRFLCKILCFPKKSNRPGIIGRISTIVESFLRNLPRGWALTLWTFKGGMPSTWRACCSKRCPFIYLYLYVSNLTFCEYFNNNKGGAKVQYYHGGFRRALQSAFPELPFDPAWINTKKHILEQVS